MNDGNENGPNKACHVMVTGHGDAKGIGGPGVSLNGTELGNHLKKITSDKSKIDINSCNSASGKDSLAEDVHKITGADVTGMTDTTGQGGRTFFNP